MVSSSAQKFMVPAIDEPADHWIQNSAQKHLHSTPKLRDTQRLENAGSSQRGLRSISESSKQVSCSDVEDVLERVEKVFEKMFNNSGRGNSKFSDMNKTDQQDVRTAQSTEKKPFHGPLLERIKH